MLFIAWVVCHSVISLKLETVKRLLNKDETIEWAETCRVCVLDMVSSFKTANSFLSFIDNIILDIF